MICAWRIAEAGKKVLIVEKMPKPALKLGITGKGRCNITNIAEIETFLKHTGPDSRFLRNVFHQFFTNDLIDFFRLIGVNTVIERGGRVFPSKDRAYELARKLVQAVLSKGAEIICNTSVTELIIENQTVKGVILDNQKKYFSGNVVVATGGLSYPATGSTGDGYLIARKAGHNVNELIPVLVPLCIDENLSKELSGLNLRNIDVSVYSDDRLLETFFGEICFSDKYIEGPLILSISRKYSFEIQNKNKIILGIDFKPALDSHKLALRLNGDLSKMKNLNLYNLIKGLLPVKLIPVFLKYAKLDGLKKNSSLTVTEINRIIDSLKNFRIEINGHAGFSRAIVTRGGVSVKEVIPQTLESRLVRNLYFIGEILDLDADTGGYNLQIAFSTGYVAGNHISVK